MVSFGSPRSHAGKAHQSSASAPCCAVVPLQLACREEFRASSRNRARHLQIASLVGLLQLFRQRRTLSLVRARAHASSRPVLQLCFDINKTIVMEDSSGRKSARELCNEALADATWGSVRGGRWEFSGAPLSLEAPDQGLISYSAWVHELFRNRPVDASDFSSLTTSRSRLAKAKEERDRLRGSFAEEGGAAPAEVAQLLQPMLSQLLIPEVLRSSPAMEAAGLAGRDTWFILPSFLAAVRELLQSDGLEQVRVSLHFRTFGSDLPAVAKEFNAFVKGEHPLHPDFCCNEDDDLELELDLANRFGSYFRDSEGPMLALGADLSGCQHREEVAEKIRSQGARLIDGYQAIHDEVREISSKGQAWCFRDYWSFWRDQAEAAEAGKLLTVSEDFHVLYMDDNARGPDGHIVDVRDRDGKRLAWPEVLAAGQVVRAWPLAALSDPDYFKNLIQSALRRVRRGDLQL
ncbi:cfa [Symbiodinium natans]|uniref:Cfa protein n=1 Tax=Symbiodinium natans TaxID=878477 RepID=A0A812UNF0_9DINO|nr:cfa [Symbiodinium natans]